MNYDQPFQHLSFLCRDYGDFSYDCSFERNVEEAKEYKESYFENTINSDNKVHNDIADDGQEKEAQVLNMFKTVSSFALPHPGNNVASKLSTGKISEISDRFRKMVGYYIESIIENIEPLQVKGNEMNVRDFILYIITMTIEVQIHD